ncbi:o-succinylbenzoate--CoA ligase [Halosolutus amylolyticus]|uniref:O-succinylbenzoate--CoA ligase n=1 Tax=Halosolutus amylolyticus TaxID=2932267 RepID=A0ABD5PMD2_9EURY|nr:o-succinylbenzoate--CoA ligase [Halosolutus amylolyticus]
MGGPAEWPTRDLLSHRAATTPQRTALIDVETDEAWTFRAFDRRVDRVASALEADGERIGVLMDTRPAFATVFFAAMRIGSTVVPLNVRETAGELASKVERTGPDAIVCERSTESTAYEIAVDARVVSVDDPGDDRMARLPHHGSDEDADGSGAASIDPVSLAPDDTALVMFTSGTSGEPKAVRLTIDNLVASASASAFRLGVDPDDRWLCCLPMYHMGGLAPVIRSVLYGTTVVIQREFDPRETARVIDEYDVTGVSLVPTMCRRLLDAGWTPPDSLRFVLLGGAPASSELLERCLEAGVPVHPTYGMTETASQIATATPDETRAHEGTAGQPLVCTDVAIVDDDGRPVETGEAGEIVVSGPTVTPGYLDDDATAAAIGDRGLHTGDVGYRDADGRLWVLNRRSDRIVTGGENVDPGEVVAVLREDPAVAEAAVVGLDDPEWGERVAALVVPAAGPGENSSQNVDPPRLLDRCADRLAGFKRPKTIAVADSLPRTASGTIDRAAVRDRLREDGIDVTRGE